MFLLLLITFKGVLGKLVFNCQTKCIFYNSHYVHEFGCMIIAVFFFKRYLSSSEKRPEKFMDISNV